MITSALILSNAIGFLLQIALPHLLNPDDYSHYSLALTYSQFLMIFCFEWIRLPLLRFSQPSNLALKERRKRLFIQIYRVIGITLLIISFSLILIASYAHELGFIAVMASSVFIVLCQGLFEGAQSYARATFNNRKFATAWIIRSVATFLICLGVAAYSQSWQAATAGYATSFLICLFAFYRSSAPSKSIHSFDREEFGHFSKYGVSLAFASLLAALAPVIFKNSLLIDSNSSLTGGTFLVFDLFTKGFFIIGMAINLLFSQAVIRHVNYDDKNSAFRLASLQFIWVLATILPALLVLLNIKNLVIGAFLPEKYYESADNSYAMIAICTALLSARMFSTDAIFISLGLTKRATAIPVIATLLWIIGLSFVSLTSTNVLISFLWFLGVSLVTSAAALWKLLMLSGRWKEIILILTSMVLIFSVADILQRNSENVFQFLAMMSALCALSWTSLYLITKTEVFSLLKDRPKC